MAVVALDLWWTVLASARVHHCEIVLETTLQMATMPQAVAGDDNFAAFQPPTQAGQ